MCISHEQMIVVLDNEDTEIQLQKAALAPNFISIRAWIKIRSS